MKVRKFLRPTTNTPWDDISDQQKQQQRYIVGRR
jgi:hypothetical protein